ALVPIERLVVEPRHLGRRAGTLAEHLAARPDGDGLHRAPVLLRVVVVRTDPAAAAVADLPTWLPAAASPPGPGIVSPAFSPSRSVKKRNTKPEYWRNSHGSPWASRPRSSSIFRSSTRSSSVSRNSICDQTEKRLPSSVSYSISTQWPGWRYC